MGLEQLRDTLAGKYEIQGEIGRGGMATVYLARDTRHDRAVALKVLDPELGAVLGAERFLSEIRVTAHLQHPNLLPLFDSGEANGLLFYVMPYVEGETLRTRLEREKQLPIDDAVRIASAVASALDYAHRHGVIHRDLKPENILLHDGQPLVADFGIALAVTKAGGARVTQTGLSLGTPQYMSPEQATGDRGIDARTDIYSLGAVTYEMLTGEPPHAGATAQAIIARLMTEQPRALSAIRHTVPAHVDAAVLCALEKLPADRFDSVKAFADALNGRSATLPPSYVARTSAATTPRAARAWIPWAVAVVGIATAAAAWFVRPAAEPAVPVALRVDRPANQRLRDLGGSVVAISPDGRTVAFFGVDDRGRLIRIRRVDELALRTVEGTSNAGAGDVQFSPDGRWLSFIGAGGGMYRVPIEGGRPIELSGNSGGAEGSAWATNDVMVVATNGMLRTLTDGERSAIALPDTAREERALSAPQVLADGRTILFTIRSNSGAGTEQRYALGAVSVNGGDRTVLPVDGTNALGVIDGWLVYGRSDGSINAVEFDSRSHKVRGQPVQLDTGIMWRANGGLAAALSRNGSLVYLRGESDAFITLLDARGARLPSLARRVRFQMPTWSPDGQRIAVQMQPTSTEGESSIWIYDVADGALSRLTSRVNAFRPTWTPDGRHIAFMTTSRMSSDGSALSGASAIWWIPSDASGQEELFYQHPEASLREIVFSADGRYAILRTDISASRGRDIYLLPRTPGAEMKPLVVTPFDEINPGVSPDSRWLAYQSMETGRFEIHVRPFPGPGPRVVVSTNGGVEPRWSADGRRIFYRDNTSFRAATVEAANGSLRVTRRDSLFADVYRTGGLGRPAYDVSRDGRFVVIREASEEAEIFVTVNWWAKVRSKLPK